MTYWTQSRIFVSYKRLSPRTHDLEDFIRDQLKAKKILSPKGDPLFVAHTVAKRRCGLNEIRKFNCGSSSSFFLFWIMLRGHNLLKKEELLPQFLVLIQYIPTPPLRYSVGYKKRISFQEIFSVLGSK